MEDNEADIFIFSEILETIEICTALNVAKDGAEAIRLLDENSENIALPDIIVLDINVPKVNGHQVARYIKSSSHLKHIPVIMLTSSSYQKEVSKAYNQHVNCFVCKPTGLDEYVETVKGIVNFWATVAILPTKNLTDNFLAVSNKHYYPKASLAGRF